MSRRGFLKTAGIAAAGVAAGAVGLGGVAHAVPTTHHVYPKNDPYQDIPAIRNAINSANCGDTILLHATKTPGGTDFTPFNLGSPISTPNWTTGTILVDRGVTISGEVFNSALSDRTVINGGFATFFIDTADAADPVNFNMLDSRSPGFCFLYYHACDGATITNVNINTVVPGPPPGLWNCPPPCGVYQAYPKGWANGIFVGNAFDSRNGVPPRIFGDFNIENCIVDYADSADALDGATLNGMGFTSYAANVTVYNCQLYNFSNNGIEAANSAGSGLTKIDLCEFSTTKATKGSFGLARLCSAIHIAITSGDYSLSNNHIFMDGRGYKDVLPALKGFHIGTNGGSNKAIETNTITAYGDGSIPIWIANESNVQCFGNTIMGAGSTGISVIYGSGSNQIWGNILTGFTSADEQILCWGHPSYGFPSSNTFEGNFLGQSEGWAVSCSGTDNHFIDNVFGLQLNNKMAAIYCDGNSNFFIHNNFKDTGLKGFNVSSSGISKAGCIFLEYGTSENTVDVAVTDLPPLTYPWYDPCIQVVDLTWDLNYDPPVGLNTINWTDGLECPSNDNENKWDQLIHMLAQYSDYKVLKTEYDAELAAMLAALEETV